MSESLTTYSDPLSEEAKLLTSSQCGIFALDLMVSLFKPNDKISRFGDDLMYVRHTICWKFGIYVPLLCYVMI